MSLLPEGASYEEVVAEVFLAVSGRGLMLSALDGALVSEWAAQGVPLEAVARGIQRTAEKAEYDRRPGAAILRSLRACRREVEAEHKRLVRLSAGEGSVTRSERQRQSGLEGAFEQLVARRPELLPAVERALASARAASDERRDEVALIVLCRGCPPSERAAIRAEARQMWEASGALSPRARKLARRFHLQAVIRHALALPRFW